MPIYCRIIWRGYTHRQKRGVQTRKHGESTMGSVRKKGISVSKGEGRDNRNLRQICGFAQKIIKTYFPHINRNPHIRLGKPKSLPFMHRVAVVMLRLTYQLHIVYPFALLYTGIHKGK